jgi:hypothetical protein
MKKYGCLVLASLTFLWGCAAFQRLVGIYVPGTPTHLQSQLDGRNNRVLLSWSGVSGDDVAYAVQVIEPYSDSWLDVETGTKETRCIAAIRGDDWFPAGDQGLVAEMSFRVKAIEGKFESDWSDTTVQPFLVHVSPYPSAAEAYTMINLGGDSYQAAATLQNTGEVRIDEPCVGWIIYSAYPTYWVQGNFTQPIPPGETVQVLGPIQYLPGGTPTCEDMGSAMYGLAKLK